MNERPFPSTETERRAALCAAAHRLYARGLVVGNEGNLSARLSVDRVLCTPTGRCKGDLRPEDLCLVDSDGVWVAGARKPTSEIQLHMEVYRRRPDAEFVVHAHPPHVLVFAVAREAIPQGILPEIDFFLGEVPIAPYHTPGGKEFAATIVPFVNRAAMIVLANHGTVAYGPDLELAVANTEMLDRYCYILLQTISLGRVRYLSADAVRDLLRLKQSKGMTDPRQTTDVDIDLFGMTAFRDAWTEAEVEQRRFRPVHPEVETRGIGGVGPSVHFEDAWLEELADRVAARLRGPRT